MIPTNFFKKSVAKFVIALALTVAATVGSAVVADQVGLDAVPSVYAGDCNTSGGGGGC